MFRIKSFRKLSHSLSPLFWPYQRDKTFTAQEEEGLKEERRGEKNFTNQSKVENERSKFA
jgi:hypothetical protein